MQDDPIARIEAGWKSELPDLRTKSMATVARINRTRALLVKHVEEGLIANGSTLADFDVLAAIRREGSPYRMKPSAIARATMLSPSGMTHRIDQLEAAGLLKRVADPENRRTMPVELTKSGRDTSERLVRVLIDIEEQAMEALTSDERADLDRLLTKLLAGLSRTD